MKMSELFEQYGNSRSLKIKKPEIFSEMYTYKESGLSINSGELIVHLAEDWNDELKGKYGIEVSELYIDSQQVVRIDEKKRLLSPVTALNELLDLDHQEVAARRAIGKLTLTTLHEQYHPTIAVNFSEKGEEFAVGQNVRICSNFTIFSPDKLLSTYDKTLGANGQYTKLSLGAIRHILRQQMANTMGQFEADVEQIQLLSQQVVTKAQWLTFLGNQFTKIERANLARNLRAISALTDEDKQLIVNSRQLAKIAVEASAPSHDTYDWSEDDTTTRWNIVNWGTEKLKFQEGSDSLTVLKHNRDWVSAIKAYSFSTS